jgi:hypothetical protein
LLSFNPFCSFGSLGSGFPSPRSECDRGS